MAPSISAGNGASVIEVYHQGAMAEAATENVPEPAGENSFERTINNLQISHSS
jgi:hypothetical protein